MCVWTPQRGDRAADVVISLVAAGPTAAACGSCFSRWSCSSCARQRWDGGQPVCDHLAVSLVRSPPTTSPARPTASAVPLVTAWSSLRPMLPSVWLSSWSPSRWLSSCCAAPESRRGLGRSWRPAHHRGCFQRGQLPRSNKNVSSLIMALLAFGAVCELRCGAVRGVSLNPDRRPQSGSWAGGHRGARRPRPAPRSVGPGRARQPRRSGSLG
jgi:hypothetical protein